MSDDNVILPTKRPKVIGAEDVSSTVQPIHNDEGNRRRQVDEHVQAFLKAVLDHAHGQKRKSLTRKLSKCDASIQTDESYLADDNGDNEVSDEIAEGYNINASASVPNFEMYSKETRHIACQQGAYFSQAHEELSLKQQFTVREDYSTGLNVTESKPNKTSSGEIRRLINEWVQKYEQWFLQNFGVDIQTAYSDSHVFSQPPVVPAEVANWDVPTHSQRTNVTSSSTTDKSSVVISRPPVKYVVSEGSLLVPETGVSPYVSLIPSFYTPDAFQRITSQPNVNIQPTTAVYIQPQQPQPQPFLIAPNMINPTVAVLNQIQILPALGAPFLGACSPSLPCSIQLPVVGFPTFATCDQPAVPNTDITVSQPTILPSCYQPTATVSTPSVVTISNFAEDSSGTSTKSTSESLADLSENFQTSAMLAALAMPLSSSNGQKEAVGRWGPPLRYGTYGRLPSALELKMMNPQKPDDNINIPSAEAISFSSKVSLQDCPQDKPKMPPPPPTFILLRRQVMICALQISCRDRGQELLLREKENVSGMPINYPTELDRVVEKSIGVRPVYVFTRLADMPESERHRFLGDNYRQIANRGVCQGMLDVNQRHCPLSEATNHLSKYGDARHSQRPAAPAYRQQRQRVEPSCSASFCPDRQTDGEFFAPAGMYCCDLLIDDVLVAQACATYKRQARISVAKQAFRILAKPCFLVGSVRSWEDVDYLVLCLSRKAELVPKLPPFLIDPFEPLDKKVAAVSDRPGSLSHDEDYEVTNPKPIEDFWIYLAMYPLEALSTDHTLVERFLAQSGEFSQMTVSFEVETNFETGHFTCIGLVDAVQLGLATASTVPEAQRQTANQLLQSLVHSQPIVGLRMDADLAVDALMWGKDERDLAVEIEQLEAHCEVPDFREDENREDAAVVRYRGAKAWSHRRLDHWLQAYAASALVTPLCLNCSVAPRSSWLFVRRSASNWGLLSQEKLGKTGLLICKRTPLPRLKSSLFNTGSFGCFQLVSKGDLSDVAIDRLLTADPILWTSRDSNSVSPYTEETPPPVASSTTSWEPSALSGNHETDTLYMNEPVTQLARRFLTSGRSRPEVKREPTDGVEQRNGEPSPLDDCVLVTAELNQPSNAIEILDDLPRTLIPGIDF